MTPRILFLVNGLGLGNATRCDAVIQALHRHGAEIQVVTSGNGLWYFRDHAIVKTVHENESFHYAASDDGRISIAGTLGATFGHIQALRRNVKRIEVILKSWKPDVVVTDSDYTSRPMKRLGIPFAAINNADVVVHQYARFTDRPKSIRAQFHAVERMDALYHRRVPDRVLSPALDTSIPEAAGNIRRIGPIVRQAMRKAPVPNVRPKRAVIMLSGSVFGSPVRLTRHDYPVDIDVVGREGESANLDGGSGGGRVRFHGKIHDTTELLKRADLAVINGGFSAVSEMFCLRKPVVVVPVPNHAEQWINARSIVEMGVGTMCEEQNLERALFNALAHINDYLDAYRRIPEIPDGAEQAAQAVLELIPA
ncbi:MAG: hypothetical protein HQL53_02255 [Magnetococcales bacterium]|nr:hypothetical protein [Magnetococcales bacterium]